jgi:hypothetical protein
MRLPTNRAVPADPKRPGPADRQARSLRTSAPPVTLTVWLALVGVSHHRRQCREMSSPRTGRDRCGIFSGFILPRSDPVAARSTPAALHAVMAASGPRSSGQRRQGGTFLFPGSFSLSLAAPPAGPPLRGRGTFGSPLKGILPTAPSSRPAPPPWAREQLRSLTIKKGTICPPRPLNPPRLPSPPPAPRSR